MKNVGLFVLFVGFVFLVFCVIVFILFFIGIYYLFIDWNGVNGMINWVGFDNFKYLFIEDK